jgi:hypothetical protein
VRDFYSPQVNLAVRVSEIWICSSRGLDMSHDHLWNPAWGPDMFSLWDLTRNKVESSGMSRLGAGYVREWLLELGSGAE